jgi:hypothetical protein
LEYEKYKGVVLTELGKKVAIETVRKHRLWETFLHNKLNFTPAIQPRALSITQGRAVGLAHYLLGGIGTTWAFFLARSISIT